MDITIELKGGAYVISNEDFQVLKNALFIVKNYNGNQGLVKVDIASAAATSYDPNSEIDQVEQQIQELSQKLPVLREHADALSDLSGQPTE